MEQIFYLKTCVGLYDWDFKELLSPKTYAYIEYMKYSCINAPPSGESPNANTSFWENTVRPVASSNAFLSAALLDFEISARYAPMKSGHSTQHHSLDRLHRISHYTVISPNSRFFIDIPRTCWFFRGIFGFLRFLTRTAHFYINLCSRLLFCLKSQHVPEM